MSRLWRDEEPIAVTLDAAGLPLSFAWHGRTHAVERIDEEWRIDTDWWHELGAVSRRYVRLTTKSGFLCEIYCDLATEGWAFSKIFD